MDIKIIVDGVFCDNSLCVNYLEVYKSTYYSDSPNYCSPLQCYVHNVSADVNSDLLYVYFVEFGDLFAEPRNLHCISNGTLYLI